MFAIVGVGLLSVHYSSGSQLVSPGGHHFQWVESLFHGAFVSIKKIAERKVNITWVCLKILLLSCLDSVLKANLKLIQQ